MRTNMGGGLPVVGFYEMKQDVYDTARRLEMMLIMKKPDTIAATRQLLYSGWEWKKRKSESGIDI